MGESKGRPRITNIDDALAAAVESLLIEGGFKALSIQAVTDRAKTTRPTFYRRFSGIPDLLMKTLQSRFGKQLVVPDSGSLFDDLLWIQRDQVSMFADPLVQRSLAGFLDALQSDADLRQVFVTEFFQPRRSATKDVVGRAVVRDEIPIPADLEWICDKLTGPLVMRALFPSLGPIDDTLALLTTEDAVRGLRAESPQM